MPVRRKLLTGIPSSHLHRLIIPDDVLIQFDLLMISTVMLPTCKVKVKVTHSRPSRWPKGSG
jgi:hypothetical protein